MKNNHLLLYYKGDISALTLFCQQADGAVCFPPLPPLAEPLPEDEKNYFGVISHPSGLLMAINKTLGLDDDLLVAEPGFYQQVDTPEGPHTVYMARFTLLDPPHELMAERGCKMQPLTALRERPPAEMELLRRAYSKVMGG